MRPILYNDKKACRENLVADINNLSRIQRLTSWLVSGHRHVPHEERLQWLSLHSLQRRREMTGRYSKYSRGLLDEEVVLTWYCKLRCVERGLTFSVMVVQYSQKRQVGLHNNYTCAKPSRIRKGLERFWFSYLNIAIKILFFSFT